MTMTKHSGIQMNSSFPLGYVAARRKRRTGHCKELVARTVNVILETGVQPRDYTHIQYCNAPAVRNGRCARHQTPRTPGRLETGYRRLLHRNR